MPISYKDIQKEKYEVIKESRPRVLNEIFSFIEEHKGVFYKENEFLQIHVSTYIIVEDFDFYNSQLKIYGFQLKLFKNSIDQKIIEIHPYKEKNNIVSKLIAKIFDWLNFKLKGN